MTPGCGRSQIRTRDRDHFARVYALCDNQTEFHKLRTSPIGWSRLGPPSNYGCRKPQMGEPSEDPGSRHSRVHLRRGLGRQNVLVSDPYNGRCRIQSVGIVVVKARPMQLFYSFVRRLFARADVLSVAVLTPLLLASGCIERPTTIDPAPVRPHAGVVLRVASSDPNDRELLRQLAASWSVRSGAEVRVLDADSTTTPTLVHPQRNSVAGRIRSRSDVPAALKSTSNPYRWDDTLRLLGSIDQAGVSELAVCRPQ